jgi:hypothetical protein
MTTETQSHTEIKVGSARSFAVVFCIVFALIGLAPLFSAGSIRAWALGVSGVFLFLAFFYTSVLQPLNIWWFRFGMLLSRIVNPLVMLLIYAVAIVPFGIAARIFGKDLLRLKTDPHAKSYWIDREPPGPTPESIEQQF